MSRHCFQSVPTLGPMWLVDIERRGYLKLARADSVSAIRARARLWRYRLVGEPSRSASYLGQEFEYPATSLIGQAIANGLEWDSILRPISGTLLASPEPNVCEVGSNIGASLLQILAARPASHVLAFEPSSRFRPFLERNLSRAGARHVEILPVLLGRQAGHALLHNNSSTASVVKEHYDGHRVVGQQITEMTTLDAVVGDRPSMHFIKIDTDGFDFEVLHGGERILRTDRPILFFELAPYLVPSSPVLELRWLQSLGYRQLVCFRPSVRQGLLGITDRPEQAVAWAEECPAKHCDVLACAEGSLPRSHLEDLLTQHWT
jgi:FkbM family methyltransferase